MAAASSIVGVCPNHAPKKNCSPRRNKASIHDGRHASSDWSVTGGGTPPPSPPRPPPPAASSPRTRPARRRRAAPPPVAHEAVRVDRTTLVDPSTGRRHAFRGLFVSRRVARARCSALLGHLCAHAQRRRPLPRQRPVRDELLDRVVRAPVAPARRGAARRRRASHRHDQRGPRAERLPARVRPRGARDGGPAAARARRLPGGARVPRPRGGRGGLHELRRRLRPLRLRRGHRRRARLLAAAARPRVAHRLRAAHGAAAARGSRFCAA